MRRLFQLSLLFLILSVQNAYAQQVVSTQDTINGTIVEFSMDQRIVQLLDKREESCAQPKREEDRKLSENETLEKVIERKNSPKNNMSVAEICRKMPKLSGFKILVAVVHSREEANKIRYEVRQKYPDLRTELDSSLRPNYRILAGSFFSRQSGKGDLSRVRGSYRSANLVPYRIFCAESK